MRARVAAALALLVASGWAVEGRADYLEIRRDALLKKEPVRDATTVASLSPSTLVALTSDEQSDGYYRVKTREGLKGYVYRTLVRRHRGALPLAPPAPARDDGDDAGRSERSRTDPAAGSGGRRRRISLGDLPDLGSSGVAEMRAHLIDVGQGHALLLEFACGAALVDTGGETNEEFNSGDALRNYLDAFFSRRADLNRTLDLLAITHPHVDHILNAELVVNRYTVKNVVTDGLVSSMGGPTQEWLHGWATGHAHLQKVTVDDIPAGGLSNEVIDPIRCSDRDPKIKALWGQVPTRLAGWSEKAFGNENNHSVVLRVDFGKASFLIPGDLEEQGIDGLLEKHSAATLDVDVLQVGHHGSKNATTPELLDVVTPALALIPSGDPKRELQWTAWDHGHPRQAVVDQLLQHITRSRDAVEVPIALGQERFRAQRVDEAIYATGWDGSIIVTASEEEAFSVKTQR